MQSGNTLPFSELSPPPQAFLRKHVTYSDYIWTTEDTFAHACQECVCSFEPEAVSTAWPYSKVIRHNRDVQTAKLWLTEQKIEDFCEHHGSSLVLVTDSFRYFSLCEHANASTVRSNRPVPLPFQFISSYHFLSVAAVKFLYVNPGIASWSVPPGLLYTCRIVSLELGWKAIGIKHLLTVKYIR